MTNREVDEVVAQFASRDIKLDKGDACTFLGAKELLSRDPQHKLALEVVRHFNRYLATGTEPWSFCKFMLGEFLTDEEKPQSCKEAEQK